VGSAPHYDGCCCYQCFSYGGGVSYLEPLSSPTYVTNNYNYYGDTAPPVEPEPPSEPKREGAAQPAPAPPSTPVLSEVELRLKEGDYYFKKGDYAKAVESFKKAVDAEPQAAAPRFALGEALFATGDYHYAAFSIRKGLELNPDWVRAKLDRREYYRSLEDYQAHLKKLEDYVRERPYDGSALFVLAYNRYFSDQKTEARELFQRVREVERQDAASELFLKELDAPAPAPPK
jgi:tetratricopeptide (TPR) repeat protein